MLISIEHLEKNEFIFMKINSLMDLMEKIYQMQREETVDMKLKLVVRFQPNDRVDINETCYLLERNFVKIKTMKATVKELYSDSDWKKLQDQKVKVSNSGLKLEIAKFDIANTKIYHVKQNLQSGENRLFYSFEYLLD